MKRRPEPEKSRGDRISGRHDSTTITRHTERNHNDHRNVYGTVTNKAEHTCILAIQRQRRKRQFCQISKNVEERVERTKNEDISSHGYRGKISSEKDSDTSRATTHTKTRCFSRSDQNEQVGDQKQVLTDLLSCNDSEQSSSGNQKKNRRDDFAQSRGDKTCKEQENESVRGTGGCRQSVKHMDGDVLLCMRNKDKDVGVKSKESERTRGEGGGRHRYRHVVCDVPLCMR